MNFISKRLTYANVMSSIAVFLVVAGGSAFAATHLGKNSVGTKQLKKNAVTTSKIKKSAVTAAKIKNNAVTSAKIKNGAVSGAKVDVSGFPTVPSATNAGHATTADSATAASHANSADHANNADNATNFSRYYTSGLRKASVGQTVTLGSIGPFTMVGKCTDEGSEEFAAEVIMTTSQPKSFLYSYASGYEEGKFEPGEEAEIDYGASGANPEWASYNGYYNDWSAESPDGAVLLQGFATSGVHVFGADCAFNLTWMNNA